MNKYNLYRMITEKDRYKESVKLAKVDKIITKEAKKNNISLQANPLEYSLFNLCDMDENYIRWYKENIINSYDKTLFYLKLFIYSII